MLIGVSSRTPRQGEGATVRVTEGENRIGHERSRTYMGPTELVESRMREEKCRKAETSWTFHPDVEASYPTRCSYSLGSVPARRRCQLSPMNELADADGSNEASMPNRHWSRTLSELSLMALHS